MLNGGAMKPKKNDYHYLLPAMIVVVVMTQAPFILTLIFSLIRWNLSRPDIARIFYGIRNYTYFLKIKDFSSLPQFYGIFFQTILITLLTLFFCSLFAFLMALLFDHAVPGVNIARTLILGPFFVMSTASGVIWKTTIFNTTFGWYGVISKAFGFTPVDWISYHPIATIVVLFTWQWMPFFFLVILAGLQGLDKDLIDCARIDGANWLQSTFKIKLPLIMNHLQVAIMLGLVFVVKEFGLILTTTAGGPGTRSYTLPYYVYMEIFSANNVGRAGALAAMTVLLTLVLVNLIYRWIQRSKRQYN
jgi:sorbitol/mannitol transport system permease protein